MSVRNVMIYCSEPHEFMRSDSSGTGHHSFSGKEWDSARTTCIRIGTLGPAPNELPGTLVYLRGQNNKYLMNGPQGDYCSFKSPGPGPNAQFLMVYQNEQQHIVSFLHVESWRWVQWAHGRIKLRTVWAGESLVRTGLPPGIGNLERFQLSSWMDYLLGTSPNQKFLSYYHEEHKEYMRCSSEGGGRGACAGKDPRRDETCILTEFYGDGPADIGGTLVTLRSRRDDFKYLNVTKYDGHCSFQTYFPDSTQFWIVVSLNESGMVCIIHRDTRKHLIWHYGSLKLGHAYSKNADGSLHGIGPWEKFQTVPWYVCL